MSQKLADYPIYEDGTTVYLLQEDSFEFEVTLGDVIAKLPGLVNDYYELGYWEGKLKRTPNNRFVNAQDVLNQIESAVCDGIAEECVDEFFSYAERPEAVEELSSLLSSWADKWMTMPVYEVKDVKWVVYNPEDSE